jgi:transcriptional regulator with XRE-family HTH domain
MQQSLNWPGIIGARLRKAREYKGLALRHLAHELDLSVALISDIERGHRSITPERRKAFAMAVDVSVEHLTPLDDDTLAVMRGRLVAAGGCARAVRLLDEMAGGAA